MTDAEQDSSLLLRRLRLFTKYVAVLALATYPVGLAELRRNYDLSWDQIASHPVQAQLLLSLCVAFVWGWLEAQPRSHRALEAIDGGLLIGFSVAWMAAVGVGAAMSSERSLHEQVDIGSATVVLTLLVLGRAALVPSRPPRTLMLSALGFAPVLALAAARSNMPEWASRQPPLLRIVGQHALCVLIATLTSSVIHNLRSEARDARRLGVYQLGDKLGEGATGVVYQARHGSMRRETALKVLRPERASPKNVRRFDREVRLAGRLTHPNTVAIYDYGRTDDGLFYYVMELCHGIDLERLVEREGPQPPARVAHILRQICGSLAEAHAIGLVHRDIKPANILLGTRPDARDVVKVADFGLARDLDPCASRTGRRDTISGTPAYLSPEAIHSPDKVDARSDLYAVGALAYFLTTGTRVFPSDGLVELVMSHLKLQPERPSDRLTRALPDALEQTILDCLAKDPRDRPQSAHEIASRLEALAATWTAAAAQPEPGAVWRRAMSSERDATPSFLKIEAT